MIKQNKSLNCFLINMNSHHIIKFYFFLQKTILKKLNSEKTWPKYFRNYQPLSFWYFLSSIVTRKQKESAAPIFHVLKKNKKYNNFKKYLYLKIFALWWNKIILHLNILYAFHTKKKIPKIFFYFFVFIKSHPQFSSNWWQSICNPNKIKSKHLHFTQFANQFNRWYCVLYNHCLH